MDRTKSLSGTSPTTTRRKHSAGVTAAYLATGAVMAIGATSARADLGNLSVGINPGVDGSVSYSQPAAGKQGALAVWAAFNVNVTNPAPNNVSNAWITFTNSQGTVFKLPPSIDATGGATGSCDFGKDQATVVCKVSMAGNSVGSLSFVLRTQAPVQPAVPPAGDKITIDWSVQSGQGSAGSNNSGVVAADQGSVFLVSGKPTDLRGYIDKTTSLAVQDTSGSSTTVAPQTLSYTVNDLTQAVADSSCSPQYRVCLQSTLSIPSATFSPPLIVDLLRTKSTLKGGAKIDNAVVTYAAISTDPQLPITQCLLSGDPSSIDSWSIPGSIPPANAQGRCFIPASPTNPFTYVDKATGDWHIRLLEFTNGITNW